MASVKARGVINRQQLTAPPPAWLSTPPNALATGFGRGQMLARARAKIGIPNNIKKPTPLKRDNSTQTDFTKTNPERPKTVEAPIIQTSVQSYWTSSFLERVSIK